MDKAWRQDGWWLSAVMVVWLLLFGLYWDYLVDDAYITFRYATHFAHGIGLVYNPNTVVDGYTSFLWTVLLGCVLFFVSEEHILLVAKLLSFAFGLLSLFGVYRLSLAAPQTPPWRWMAVALTALSPAFVISSADGLETPLYTYIQLTFVIHWLKDVERGSASAASGMWGALLALTRPDGILLVALTTVLFVVLPTGKRVGLKSWLPFVLVWLAIYLPYFVWHLAYYGHPFPNTFYAKMGGEWRLFVQGLHRLGRWTEELGSVVSMVFVLYVLIKSPCAYTRVMTAVIVSRVLLVLWSGGEVMGHHRFLAPAVPAYWLLFQLGFSKWLVCLSTQRGLMPRVLIVLLPLLCIFLFAKLLDTLPRCRQYADGLQRAHVTLGKWIHSNTSRQTVIAVGDAGAIPFYARRHTIDIMGLNDPHIARLKGRLGSKIDVGYILSQKPDLLILLSEYPPSLPFRGLTPIDQALYDAPEVRKDFRLLHFYRFGEGYFLWVLAHKETECLTAASGQF